MSDDEGLRGRTGVRVAQQQREEPEVEVDAAIDRAVKGARVVVRTAFRARPAREDVQPRRLISQACRQELAAPNTLGIVEERRQVRALGPPRVVTEADACSSVPAIAGNERVSRRRSLRALSLRRGLGRGVSKWCSRRLRQTSRIPRRLQPRSAPKSKPWKSPSGANASRSTQERCPHVNGGSILIEVIGALPYRNPGGDHPQYARRADLRQVGCKHHETGVVGRQDAYPNHRNYRKQTMGLTAQRRIQKPAAPPGGVTSSRIKTSDRASLVGRRRD